MSKARKIGIKSTFTPNAKADLRFRKNTYLRGMDRAYRCQYEIPEEKQHRKYERLKQQEAAAKVVQQ